MVLCGRNPLLFHNPKLLVPFTQLAVEAGHCYPYPSCHLEAWSLPFIYSRAQSQHIAQVSLSGSVPHCVDFLLSVRIEIWIGSDHMMRYAVGLSLGHTLPLCVEDISHSYGLARRRWSCLGKLTCCLPPRLLWELGDVLGSCPLPRRNQIEMAAFAGTRFRYQ